jgi:hypothetical protein
VRLTAFAGDPRALVLAGTNDPGNRALFDLLGDGRQIGRVSVSEADEGEWLEIELGADGVAAANRGRETSRSFAMGLVLDSHQVPEPQSGVLTACCVMFIVAASRKRRLQARKAR